MFIFKLFKFLEIDFVSPQKKKLKKMDKSVTLSELRYLFKKILTHHKTDLKHAITIYKVLVSKSEAILTYCGLQKSCFT